jgi:hypothetical protein
MGQVYSTVLSMSVQDSIIEDFILTAAAALDHWPPTPGELAMIKELIKSHCDEHGILYIDHEGGL